MPSWKRISLDIVRRIANVVDRLRFRLKTILKIGTKAPVSIAAYRGYGTYNQVFLQGRVLKEKLIIWSETDSKWKNLRNNFKRMRTSEIMDALLEIKIGQNQFHVKTDQEGYFLLESPLPQSLKNIKHPWFPITIRCLQTPWRPVDLEIQTHLLVPSKEADLGIISDIDDTVLQTDVTYPLKLMMIYHTFFKNAARRQTFNETAAFYRSLQQGASGNSENPFFYVSNSPWNLYDLLEDFLYLNNLPLGPILLRDFGIPHEMPPKDYRGHKYTQIERILNTYPDLPFVLIGDSGEKDIEIYLSIARAFPEKIKAIYIRDVQSRRKTKKVSKIIRQSKITTPVSLFEGFGEAAFHAASKRLIQLEAFNKFSENAEED